MHHLYNNYFTKATLSLHFFPEATYENFLSTTRLYVIGGLSHNLFDSSCTPNIPQLFSLIHEET